MSTSRLWQKIGASAINCSLVLLLTLPLYPLFELDAWKLITIANFWIYNMIFRRRCLGMRIVGTYIDPPTSPLYALLYTMAFSGFLYSVIFPFDLLLANGLIQTVSIMTTGNTLHGALAGQGTMSQEQYIERCQLRALALLNQGLPGQAVGSMACDLNRYPELRAPPELTMIALAAAKAGDIKAVREWIMGFNQCPNEYGAGSN